MIKEIKSEKIRHPHDLNGRRNHALLEYVTNIKKISKNIMLIYF